MSRQKPESDGHAPVQQKNNGLHKLLDQTASSTYEDIMSIIEARIELLKIELTEKISLVGAAVVIGVILIIGIGYLITTFALLVGELLGHTYLGYLLVSLVCLSCFLFFTKLKPSFLKNLIQKMLLSVHDYKK